MWWQETGRNYYIEEYSNSDCLKQLYLSLIFWDSSSSSSDIGIFQSIQKFALRISYKLRLERNNIHSFLRVWTAVSGSSKAKFETLLSISSYKWWFHFSWGSINIKKPWPLAYNLSTTTFMSVLCQVHFYCIIYHTLYHYRTLPSALHCVDVFSEFKRHVLSYL